jgi:hypothetical protein
MQIWLEQFVWYCAEGGYQWETLEPVPLRWRRGQPTELPLDTRYLVERKMAKPRYRRYNPFASEPTLYREFGRLERTEDAFAAFASSYGPLGGGDATVAHDGTVVPADPLSMWFEARQKIREVADVLDAIQGDDADTLSKWFRFEKDRIMYERHHDDTGHRAAVVAGGGFGKEWLVEWASEPNSPNEAIIRASKGWAQHTINEALRAREIHQRSSTSAQVLFNHERRDMTLHIVPSTLVAAMWLQCARVLTLNPQFKSCDHCGKWFELSPDARRKHTKYCQDKCKVAAYRVKKKAATISA